MGDDTRDEDRPFVTRLGPVTVDWPRTLGFYGGLGLAVAFDLVAPPLAAFVALVPLLKLLKRKDATKTERAIAAVLEGAAQPVGGDAESTIRPTWQQDEKEKDERDERERCDDSPPGVSDAPRQAAE